MWEKIEQFLNRIHKKEIKSQKFYLYGWEEGYTQVASENKGYLPFYLQEDLVINVDILDDKSPLKPNKLRKSTNYITLHNTGMAHPSATAKGLNEYIHKTDRIASWHFSIDDIEVFQELKIDEIGWHAGDGSNEYGTSYINSASKKLCIGGGNLNSIGIEMCVYAGVDFNKVMRNTAKLVADLLIKYELTTSSVRQHFDFSGKNCPQVLREANRWNEMIELISLEYYAKTELKGVSFKWLSLTPKYLDNTGAIINNSEENNIKYSVSVNYQNQEKTFEYKSKIIKYKEEV